MIGQQIFSKNRIITINNWEIYQTVETGGHKNGHQTDNRRTTRGQHADTYKNDKNEKNEKNEKKYYGDIFSNKNNKQSVSMSRTLPIISIARKRLLE